MRKLAIHQQRNVLTGAFLIAAVAMAIAGGTPAQAAKFGGGGMRTAVVKTSMSKLPPKAVRDHRRPVCGPWAKTPDDCRKRPYRW